MSASPSVLQAHRYRAVIESLSKPKFALFPCVNSRKKRFENRNLITRIAAQETIMPEKSAPAFPLRVEQRVELRRFGAERRHRAGALGRFLASFRSFSISAAAKPGL